MNPLKQKLEMMRNGEGSASANVNESIKIIEARNKELNALVYVNKADALDKAKLIDSIPKPDQGRLHGLTFSAKDHYQIEGLPCSEGSTQTAIKCAGTTDAIIESILLEGAILIGKGNMPEYGKSNFTDNELYGRTVNPWNKDYTCGGSSGGDAVAVASGMADFGIGGDSGGSLRVPASFCGLYSILPTRGLIKRSDSPFILNTFLKSMGSPGPLARTLEDLELVFDILVRENVFRPSPLSPRGQGEKTFTVLKQVGGVGCTPDILAALDKAAARLKNIGFKEIEVNGKVFDDTVPVFFTLGGQAGTLQEDLARTAQNISIDLEKETTTIKNLRADIKKLMPPMTLESLLMQMYEWDELKKRSEKVFEKADIILAPVAAVPPLKNGATEATVNGTSYATHHLFHFSRVANVLDMPAVSFPVELNAEGLPIGLQIMSKSGHDRFLIRTLHAAGFVNALTK
jgi:Asp-tRNA(Asn)/Glu-tRNA(Gln) amidotransferase A subunit family amidase